MLYSQKGIYTPVIFSIFSLLVKHFGTSGLPLLRLVNASIATLLSFLKGIILDGANSPDNLSFNIAVLPQYTQKVAAVFSSAIISALQFLHKYVTVGIYNFL